MQIANKCDEVMGELKAVTEEDFQKLQRPIEGYTLKEYISNMALFNKQYNGKFILEVTIIRDYNDSDESVNKLKEIIDEISPDQIIVERMNDERFKKKLDISDKRFKEIIEVLQD